MCSELAYYIRDNINIYKKFIKMFINKYEFDIVNSYKTYVFSIISQINTFIQLLTMFLVLSFILNRYEC